MWLAFPGRFLWFGLSRTTDKGLFAGEEETVLALEWPKGKGGKKSPESRHVRRLGVGAMGVCSCGTKGSWWMREEARVCVQHEGGKFKRRQLPFWDQRLGPSCHSGSGHPPPYSSSASVSASFSSCPVSPQAFFVPTPPCPCSSCSHPPDPSPTPQSRPAYEGAALVWE